MENYQLAARAANLLDSAAKLYTKCKERCVTLEEHAIFKKATKDCIEVAASLRTLAKELKPSAAYMRWVKGSEEANKHCRQTPPGNHA